MKLPENIVQKLKDKKISFNKLSDRYFADSLNPKDSTSVEYFEVKNIQLLLNNDICSFKQLVDRAKSLHDARPRLHSLVGYSSLFKDLIQNNTLTREDLKYLLHMNKLLK